MTIVVTDGKVMAADTLIDDNGSKYYAPKIFIGKASIIGVSGDYMQARQFVRWFSDRRAKKPKGDWECLVWTPKSGLEIWTQEFEPLPFTGEFWAVGSGRDAALGSMYAGAHPTQAAAIACKISEGCGGSVDAIPLNKDSLKMQDPRYRLVEVEHGDERPAT